MGYTIPQNWNDEAMEYVNRLTDKINVGWDGEDYCLSDWNLRFLSRMNRGVINPPFKYEAFLDNEDIIATLEGYELDVEKFWFALLFIYDMTMDITVNVVDAGKTDYDVLVEINDYLEKHPQASLYLSDDKKLPKSNCYETNRFLILDNLRRFVKGELAKYEEPPQLRAFSVDLWHKRNYTELLPSSCQQVFMYKKFDTLFSVLELPEKRAKKREIVSYSKMLLISRLIYFCRLTPNESFTVDSSSLKGVLKEYGHHSFKVIPKVYM